MRVLESGEFSTVAELAERERIAPSYMTRVLRMTLFAPEIGDAILHGQQGAKVTSARVLEPFLVEWEKLLEGLNTMVWNWDNIANWIDGL